MAGLYVHIPFCRRACHYCDFHFSTSLRLKDDLLAALRTEIGLRRDYLEPQPALSSVYFGGGTPSLLAASELNALFETIHAHFTVAPDAEITLEANPDDLTPSWLRALRTTPVNRLSIGLQSFHEPHLRLMNRVHTAEESYASVRAAQDAGFTNLSIDLIYGIPTDPLGDHAVWERDLHRALELQAPHVSAYALTVEPDTALGHWTKTGRFRPAPDEFTATQMERLVTVLTGAGYHHYEVSNFAQPGHEARHNSAYWAGSPYLGIGPSAHSFDGHLRRQANVAHNARYISAIQAGEVPATVEDLTPRDRANEVLMTTLRTSAGCDLVALRTRFGRDVAATHEAYLRQLEARGLATWAAGILRLTAAGRLLADDITLELFE